MLNKLDYLKKLRMRSIRRGTKEMDIILGKFSNHLRTLDNRNLKKYEQLLEIDDNKIYKWITNQEETDAEFKDLIVQIKRKIY
tara:strand:- start:22 stop:270 length:249 start_codon:yes stop_codon:yes gene_type:complete